MVRNLRLQEQRRSRAPYDSIQLKEAIRAGHSRSSGLATEDGPARLLPHPGCGILQPEWRALEQAASAKDGSTGSPAKYKRPGEALSFSPRPETPFSYPKTLSSLVALARDFCHNKWLAQVGLFILGLRLLFPAGSQGTRTMGILSYQWLP